MEWSDELFVRRYDDLADGVNSKDDYELLNMAAVLRQLLLDEEPLLHRANRERKLDIKFTINRVSRISELPFKSALIFHGYGLDPKSINLKKETESLPLKNFLKHPIIESKSGIVSVSDLIKFSANKAGGVHLDSKRNKEEQQIESLLAKASMAGTHTIAVSLQTIARIVVVALQPLREAIVKLPKSFPLLAHYKLPRKGSVQFDGVRQYMETDLRDKTINGISLNIVMNIFNQPEPGDRVIYEIGNLNNPSQRITIFVDPNGGLSVKAMLTNEKFLAVKAENFLKSEFFGSYVGLSADLSFNSGKADLSLHINGQSISKDRCDFSSATLTVSKHTIGANLSGNQAAAFRLKEMIIGTRGASTSEQQQIGNYLFLQWHK